MQREVAIAEDFWRETLKLIEDKKKRDPTEDKKKREPNEQPMF